MNISFENIQLVHSRKLHRHKFHANWRNYNHCSFLLATEGQHLYYQKDNGERYTLNAPFVFWHHPNCTYRYGPMDSGTRWTHYYAAFTGGRALDLMENGFMRLNQEPFFAVRDAVPFIEMFESIIKVQESQSDFMSLEAILHIESMLLELRKQSQRKCSKTSPHENKIIQLASQIRQNPLHDLDFHEWARSAGMSYSNFRLLFRKTLKTSPQKYLFTQRMKWARMQIIESTKPIQEIGYTLGYENPAVFSRAFKQYAQVSPQALRKPFQWELHAIRELSTDCDADAIRGIDSHTTH